MCVVRSTRPRRVSLDHVVQISCGQYHCLALDRSGRVYAWGWGVHGQLGNGAIEDVDRPRRVGRLGARIVVQVYRWRDGEMERWRDGEMERWRDGEMERWRDGWIIEMLSNPKIVGLQLRKKAEEYDDLVTSRFSPVEQQSLHLQE